jgi:hypothetical protein
MVSLKAACFAHNQYEDQTFLKCFSNLVASGFRRFVADLYWDESRSVWNFCPVQLADLDTQHDAEASVNVQTVSSSSQSGAAEASPTNENKRFANKDAIATWVPVANQEESAPALITTSVSTATSSFVSEVSSNTISATATSTPSLITAFSVGQDNHPLFQVRSYNCTTTVTLDLLAAVLDNFLQDSETTTDAQIIFLTLNVHAAASRVDPDAPAPRPTALPEPGNYIRDVFKGNLSDDAYTPALLQYERNNLNDSWFDVKSFPEQSYYHVSTNANGHFYTRDGWPSEAYMEFEKFYRLIVGFGSVDPQMVDYNISADFDTVFEPGYLTSIHNVSLGTSGNVINGCLNSPSDLSITESTNSSWAVALVPPFDLGSNPDPWATIPAVTNLTNCGFTTFLNTTLSNVTADVNPAPYLAFSRSQLWTWAPNQPTIASPTSKHDRNRCAAMLSSGTYAGRWVTVTCSERHRVACKDPNQPYNWVISEDSISYTSGDSACPHNSAFDVPGTPLENAHLLSAIQSASPALPSDNNVVLLNLNSMDVNNCWAVGVNGTCPYTPRMDLNKTRVVVVPTIAAVIIFLVAALTFFVKCASNRREDRQGKRRRYVGGWDYEGVPS